MCVCVCGKSITVTNRRKQKVCRAAQSSITQVLSSSWSAVNTHIVLQEALDGPVHLCWDVGSTDLTGKKPEAHTDCCPHCGSHPVSVCITPECSWVFGLIPNPAECFQFENGFWLSSVLPDWVTDDLTDSASLTLKLVRTVWLVMKAFIYNSARERGKVAEWHRHALRKRERERCSDDLGVKLWLCAVSFKSTTS